MAISTRIYAGGALLFGGQPAIDDLIAAGYSAVILWTLHVSLGGDLTFNGTPIVVQGAYQKAQVGDLAERLAQLKKAGMQIIFCVGEDTENKGDYYNINQILSGGPTSTPYKNLNQNFLTLLQVMADAGADIDAIDMDNEDFYEGNIVVLFADMLKEIGFPSVTFCPYTNLGWWKEAYDQLTAKYGQGFVSALHLQCYDGGSNNDPGNWLEIAYDSHATLVIPGLASNQAQPGPWWDGKTSQMGGSVVKTAGVAQYGLGDWSTFLRVDNFSSADIALQHAQGATFFFYCNGPLDLGPGKQFQTGDAVYFAGIPTWGSAEQCDAYALGKDCGNRYNYCLPGACPSDLQTQFASWKKSSPALNGGFIWMYDSVLSCLLAGCCNGTTTAPTATASAYRQAITNGLA